MQINELLVPSGLLTGYVPGAEALSAVANLASKLRKDTPDLIYLLDPVMGDSGRLYVAPDVVPVYRNMLPLATVITPNWFEVETLTDIELKDLLSLRRALTALHKQYHVPNVVISSIPLKQWMVDALPPHIRPPETDGTESNLDYLLCISSSASQGTSDKPIVHAQIVPLLPGYFSGVGDLFSALLLAHFDPDPSNAQNSFDTTPVSRAASQALTKTHAVLCLTHEYSQALPEDERQPTDDEKDRVDPLRKIKRMKGRELRLVQGQDIIRGTEITESRQMKPWTNFWGAQ